MFNQVFDEDGCFVQSIGEGVITNCFGLATDGQVRLTRTKKTDADTAGNMTTVGARIPNEVFGWSKVVRFSPDHSKTELGLE